jgi:hypothetical protein
MEQKARRLGASEFGLSDRKDKRFYVVYGNKIIHFGLKHGHTFIDHHDKIKRDNWRKRHSKIKNKRGEYVYLLKSSPSFWSYNLLW